MQETENLDGRLYLLHVILQTPMSEKTIVARFVQLSGIEIIRDWIEGYRRSEDSKAVIILNQILSVLNRLGITIDILERTKIGKKVGGLTKHTNASISAKAGSLISKWKKLLAPKEERKPVKPKLKDSKPSQIKT
jgi:hypothetical protein